ncbi:MAG TPA: CD225/dispanin family protein [Thermoanaerobaculia bacterium]|nr:CD225/dispanin family protein [Thermoanaerobaculia bacterium]
MFCPNCRTSNLDNASICINCGKALTSNTPHSYTPPPPPPRANAGYAPPQPSSGESIPNYLVHSIIVTLCCCMPLGIVGIVFAAQVNSKLALGDYMGAREASAKAKLFTMIGFGIGLVGVVILFLMAGASIMEAVRVAMENR